jgi:hypothetical protein
MPVTSDREGLTTRDGVHDLFGPAAKVALVDLRLSHDAMVRDVPLSGTM